MIAYVDSSVALRFVLGEPNPLREWDELERSVSSAILGVECFRALERLRLARRHSDVEMAARYESLRTFIAPIDFLDVTSNVLERAGQPLGMPLKTLDAIHLATALLWRETASEESVFATHDRTLGSAARSYGLRVLGL